MPCLPLKVTHHVKSPILLILPLPAGSAATTVAI